jgi:hypothetical protein
VEKAEKCSLEASSASADAVAAAAAAQAISDTLQPADPHYDPTSWTAQSGVAVEEALSEERSRVNGNFANAIKETKSGKTVTFSVSAVAGISPLFLGGAEGGRTGIEKRLP